MKSDLTVLFVKRLSEEQKRVGLSDNQLAKIARIGQSTISSIKRGRQDPTLRIVAALADALQVPYWYLLIERGEVEIRVYRPPVVSVPL